ncbi:MAG TPA: Gfo/Idh/MocA family oxidoreductase [Planctomycetota bacterium]|nr:Gfo/Idh/MocA family oxidoreductase [Planctomycetota bacterium]
MTQPLPEIGVGMIGYGFMGRMHTYAYQSLPFLYDPPPARIRRAVVCTAHRETAHRAAEHGGYERAVTDYRRVVEDPAVDVVHVCTPNAAHREACVAALEAGKHVYCDKPLALNVAEAEEIVAAADSAPQVRHQMTFQYRFLPATLRAKELMEAGFVGRLFSYRAAYLHAGYVEADRPMSWRLDAAASGGGALFDLGAHVIDLMRHLAGEVASVSARCKTFITERPNGKGGRAPVEVDDLALMQVELAGGALGTIECSRLATGTNDELRFELHGEQGALRFNLMDPNWLYAYDHRDATGPYGGDRGFKAIEAVQRYPAPAALPGPKNAIGWTRAHVACLYNFIACVVEGRPSKPDFRDGLAVQRIMAAAQQSSQTGRWVDIQE